MRTSRQAYTLTELIVVIAVIAVLSAFLMPVFVSVKSEAKKSVCFSNFKQVAYATALYVDDYDDRYMPISYKPGVDGSSRDDRTWVQLLLPYAPSFSIFLCPSDTSRRGNADTTFDQDLIPGDLYSEYYGASKHTNSGYNYMTLSPVVRENNMWLARPRMTSEIAQPSSTMMYLDSAWAVEADGQPEGGGNWLVEPPCRYITTPNGTRVDLLAADGKAFADIFAVSNGWTLTFGSAYGGAWPWHFGHVNVARADLSASSYTPDQLGVGCDVEPNWSGSVTSATDSIWFASSGNPAGGSFAK